MKPGKNYTKQYYNDQNIKIIDKCQKVGSYSDTCITVFDNLITKSIPGGSMR